MSDNPYRLRQREFAHLLWLGLMPAGVHAFSAVLFGAEAESAAFMLLMTVVAAGAVGAFLCKRGYGPVVSAAAGAWPAVLAVWRHWHWSLNMPSPGGSAQSLVRAVGWRDASMPAAVAAVMISSGAAGWLFMRFNFWYERKTGRPLFDAE